LPVHKQREREPGQPVNHEAARHGAEIAYVIHAASFVFTMGLLVTIWALTGHGYFWPVWPAITWGPALGIHAWVTYGLLPKVSRSPELTP
jgi:2TM domain